MRFFCLSLCLFAFACGPNDEQSSLSRDRSKTSEVASSYDSRSSSSDHAYPLAPELSVTAGSKCTRADEYRYPEKIPYCRRSVSSGTKNQIISNYDKKFGYHIEDMRRNEFKIDHFIPLCMGGSNNQNNLWPQHEDIYPLTDPIEARLCDLLASGRIKQSFAIDKLVWIKFHLDEAKAFLNQMIDVQHGKKSVAEFIASNKQHMDLAVTNDGRSSAGDDVRSSVSEAATSKPVDEAASVDAEDENWDLHPSKKEKAKAKAKAKLEESEDSYESGDYSEYEDDFAVN